LAAVVESTVGLLRYELAASSAMPMLSKRGHPDADDLINILQALEQIGAQTASPIF